MSRVWAANQSARKTLSTDLVYTKNDYHALPPRFYSSCCNAARRASQEKKWWLWYEETGQLLNDRFGFRGVDFARILERSLNYVIGTSWVLILAMSIGKYDVMCTVAHKDKTLPRIQKHFPESKTLPRIQNTSQNSKHFPESKTISQNLDSGKCFWILGSVLNSGKCFWILGSVLDSGKCFWILGSVLSLRATVDVLSRLTPHLGFCGTFSLQSRKRFSFIYTPGPLEDQRKSQK